MEERVNPLIVRDTETGEEYTLEFSRESVKFAEDRKFNINELLDYPQTNIPALWFYAFRMHHKNVARNKTDKMLEDLGGLSKEVIERLVLLYQQPNLSLIKIDDDGGQVKNAKMTVELL